jgi:hypothetical protein
MYLETIGGRSGSILGGIVELCGLVPGGLRIQHFLVLGFFLRLCFVLRLSLFWYAAARQISAENIIGELR